MDQFLQFALLGVGAGAVYGALGLGLVLTFRSSGVINFAHGAMAMYIAYVYDELRRRGDYVFPVPGLPARVHLYDHVTFATAVVLSLLTAVLLGLLVYLLVFRPLRHAPALARVVASVGLLVTLQAIVVLRFGTDNRNIPAVLPARPVQLLGVTIASDRLLLFAMVVAVAALLVVVFRYTRFGLATRAAAENEKGASLLGLSPDALAAVNWVLATLIAGATGILVGPITALDPVNYTLLVVPALGAALVGRFTSFGWTVAAALVIGVLQSEITTYQTDWSWLPRTGSREAVPFLVIVLALALLGRRLPTRGAVVERRQPTALRPRRVPANAAVWTAIALGALLLLHSGYRSALVISLNAAVICLSIVVLTGFVGQISLAQMAFAGAAGFTLSTFSTDLSLPFPVAPLLAALVAALLGLLVGLPALRVRGVNLAVVTLGLGVAVVELWFKNPDYTGGFAGSPIPPPSLFGLRLGAGSDLSFGVFSLVVLVLLALGVVNLRRSPTGRRMLAVRANERAAAAAGIDPATTKLLAFAVSAFIAGLGGALLGYRQTQLSFESFGVFVSLSLLAVTYLGGIANVSGAMVGGVLATGGIGFYTLNELFGFGRYEGLIGGVGLILTAILNPEGISGAVLYTRDALLGRRARPGAADGPAVPGASSPPARAQAAAAVVGGTPGSTYAGHTVTTPLLDVRDLTVRYGGVTAVDAVSLAVPQGALVGLIGPNGAGKTTMIDALSGFTRSTGSIEFAGHQLGGVRPHRIPGLGLTRTFQSLELFEDLTVRENLLVSADPRPWWAVLRDVVAPRAGAADGRVDAALAAVGLPGLAHRLPGALSHGQRKLVAVARALCSAPRLLLLDEPAAGLDSEESLALGAQLRSLVQAGTTVLLVDHDMGLVLSVCDEIHVLKQGALLASGPPAVIRRDPAVVAAYLGEHEAGDRPAGRPARAGSVAVPPGQDPG